MIEDVPLQQHRASGKLMLTGEYLVLYGATAWAVPTRLGQTLSVAKSPAAGLKWRSIDSKGNLWFEALWDGEGKLLSYTDIEVADTLNSLLQMGVRLGSNPFAGWRGEITMDFPREWGLGSSSSLVACLAHWMKVEPFQLFDACLSGSGYDVAVAYHNDGILYNLLSNAERKVELFHHTPPFTEHLYFAYSGAKQNSHNEVVNFQKGDASKYHEFIPKLNRVSEQMWIANTLESFQEAVIEHEEIIGMVLGREGMNSKYEINGAMKHLGAWGGDFFLVATNEKSDLDKLKEHGITEIFNWKDIISDY